MIAVEVESQEEARLIAKGLQLNETIRSLAAIFGKLNEHDDVDPSDYLRVIDMAREIRYGKRRH